MGSAFVAKFTELMDAEWLTAPSNPDLRKKKWAAVL